MGIIVLSFVVAFARASDGIDVSILSGDRAAAVAPVARELAMTAQTGMSPQDKLAALARQSVTHKVLMIGDGLNDAPALAQADVGIAMGSGTDVAMEAGGIVLMKSDLRDVVSAVELSRETLGKIRQNLFFSLFYNVIGIPVAARVFVGLGIVLRPELAGLAMALSSVSVVSNSLLLRRFQPGRRNWVSTFAPIVMTVAFTAAFVLLARVSVMAG